MLDSVLFCELEKSRFKKIKKIYTIFLYNELGGKPAHNDTK